MATTLDVISNGRLELGIGSGSYEAEHLEAGLPWGSFAERTDRLAEALDVITAMFSGEPTTYSGTHYQLRELPNLPPPTQTPRPPLHIGGAGERYTLPLVARHADVWNVPTYALGEFAAKRDALARACEAIGRDRSTVRIALEAVLVVAPDDAAVDTAREQTLRRFPGPGWGVAEGGFVGTPAAIVDRMQSYIEHGVSLFTFFLHDRATDATLDLLAGEVASKF
jgi:alkanesulfonate monooxygenase SsuD/methylene tetrahydromethanopterin reductase-like flavin-dependent oxidoreductase (luciferase family)